MLSSIDQNQDFSKRELYKYLSGKTLPSFVKQAELDSVGLDRTSHKISKTAFADPDGRYFPVNNKVRTYVSAVYFINKAAALVEEKGLDYVKEVASNIDKAASLFGVNTEIEKYAFEWVDQKIAENEGEGDQSISMKVAEAEIALFTIKSASECTAKANDFAKRLNKYPFEWRREIAEKFVKAAEHYGLEELPDVVLKYAGHYYPDVTEVRKELARRATKLTGEAKDSYEKVAADLPNFSSIEDFFKLSHVCYFTEKNAGLYEKPYQRKILGDPVDKLFTLHLDKVAELMDVVNMGGEKFAAEDLRGVASDIYEKSFGFQIDPKEAEFKDIAPTLPLSDVALFKSLSGVKPI